MNRINGLKGGKQLSLAIILMYDHLDFELLLLIRNSFHAFTNINSKEGGSCPGLQKGGRGVSGWGDDQEAEDLLPCLINLIAIENNCNNYHFIHNKPTIDIIHLMNYGIYTLINHPTLNNKI